MFFYRPVASYQDVLGYSFTEESLERLALLGEDEKGWAKFIRNKKPLKIEGTDLGAWCTDYFGKVPDWLFHRYKMLPEKEYPLQLNRMVVVSEKIKNILEEFWLPPAHLFIPVEAFITVTPYATRASEADKSEEIVKKNYFILFMPTLEQFENVHFPSVAICIRYYYDIYDNRILKEYRQGEITSYEQFKEEYERFKTKHTFIEIEIYGGTVCQKPYDLVFLDRLLVSKELREALYESKLKGVVFQKWKDREVIFLSDN